MTDEIDRALADFRNRKIYSAFDLQTLEKIPDSILEQAILDYVCNRLSEDRTREVATLDSLSHGFRAIFLTIDLEGEVCNGGFNQYFWNSEGRFATHAVEAFRRIGAPEYADLLERAIRTWRAEVPVLERFKETDTLEAFFDSYKHTTLGALDDEFYAL